MKFVRSKSNYFGERALLAKEKRAATVEVISEEATVLALSKDRFEEILGSLAELQKMHKETKGAARKSMVAGAGLDTKFKPRGIASGH